MDGMERKPRHQLPTSAFSQPHTDQDIQVYWQLEFSILVPNFLLFHLYHQIVACVSQVVYPSSSVTSRLVISSLLSRSKWTPRTSPSV
jgi:hypothetical protein